MKGTRKNKIRRRMGEEKEVVFKSKKMGQPSDRFQNGPKISRNGPKNPNLDPKKENRRTQKNGGSEINEGQFTRQKPHRKKLRKKSEKRGLPKMGHFRYVFGHNQVAKCDEVESETKSSRKQD
jgi:hypothetical protein